MFYLVADEFFFIIRRRFHEPARIGMENWKSRDNMENNYAFKWHDVTIGWEDYRFRF